MVSVQNMLGTTQVKSFVIIEWGLFFALCGLSLFFMKGVLDNYFSGMTSFTQSEGPLKEFPTVVLCFSVPNSRNTKYEYGSDFQIKYSVEVHGKQSGINLKQGENASITGEMLYFIKIASMRYGNCYKLTSMMTNNDMIKIITDISINFNSSITEENIPSLEIFLTSENNAYGVVFNKWVNGKVIKLQIDKGIHKHIELRQQQYNYLEKNFKCSHEAYYECVSRHLVAKLNGTCSSMPSLPYIPTCKINKSKEEHKMFNRYLDLYLEECPTKQCVTQEYHHEYEDTFRLKKTTFQFSYSIPSNSTTLYKEYLIYDTISMIGSVGGTLGMCIGFSFTGMISYLMNLLQHGIMLTKRKFYNKNISTSHLQSEPLNDTTIKTNAKFLKYKEKIYHQEERSFRDEYSKNQINHDKLEEKMNELKVELKEFLRSECSTLLKGYSDNKNEKYLKDIYFINKRIDNLEKKLKTMKLKL